MMRDLESLTIAGFAKACGVHGARPGIRCRLRRGVLRGRRHDPIIVNIGINAGPALVGTTRLRGRSGEQGFYSATGPVTNIAARLCALATEGQILSTGNVARMLNGIHPVRRLGLRRLKNVSAPVEVFEIQVG